MSIFEEVSTLKSLRLLGPNEELMKAAHPPSTRWGITNNYRSYIHPGHLLDPVSLNLWRVIAVHRNLSSWPCFSPAVWALQGSGEGGSSPRGWPRHDQNWPFRSVNTNPSSVLVPESAAQLCLLVVKWWLQPEDAWCFRPGSFVLLSDASMPVVWCLDAFLHPDGYHLMSLPVYLCCQCDVLPLSNPTAVMSYQETLCWIV